MLSTKTCAILLSLTENHGRWIWKHLPDSVLSSALFRSFGKKIHEAISRRDRIWSDGYCRCNFTRFFRNIPLLEVLRDLAAMKAANSELSIASIGCSSGAELYSLLWYVRSARPDLKIRGWGLDISESVIVKARVGCYFSADEELAWLSKTNLAALFDNSQGDLLKIKPFLRQGTKWLVADASDPELSSIIGPQDFVLANNFLGPFWEAEAEKCLSNISRLVKPNGYLVLFGVDLDVRTRWVKRQAYIPVTDKIEQVHVGDRVMLDWPWTRWGVEPIDKGRADWQTRYAVVFQIQGHQEELTIDRIRPSERGDRQWAVSDGQKGTG